MKHNECDARRSDATLTSALIPDPVHQTTWDKWRRLLQAFAPPKQCEPGAEGLAFRPTAQAQTLGMQEACRERFRVWICSGDVRRTDERPRRMRYDGCKHHPSSPAPSVLTSDQYIFTREQGDRGIRSKSSSSAAPLTATHYGVEELTVSPPERAEPTTSPSDNGWPSDDKPHDGRARGALARSTNLSHLSEAHLRMLQPCELPEPSFSTFSRRRRQLQRAFRLPYPELCRTVEACCTSRGIV
jgi:hypothetical protein